MPESLDACARRVASSWLRSTHFGGRSMGHMDVTYALPRGNAYSVPAPSRSVLDAICTLRPDGHVAWTGEDQADLLSRMPKWFGAAAS